MKINNFKKKLICWGAGDQAIVLRHIVRSLGADYDILVDDTPNKLSPFSNIELLPGKKSFEQWLNGRDVSEYCFVIAIGNPFGFVRCALHDFLISKGIEPVNICSQSAILDDNVELSDGIQIMNGAIISTLVKIGKQVIINTRSTIEHHGYIDKGVEIGPCATLCGRVTVNKYSWVCAGATVLPRIIIGKNSIIGASAMVGKNVPDDSVFVGVPAKFLKSNINKI